MKILIHDGLLMIHPETTLEASSAIVAGCDYLVRNNYETIEDIMKVVLEAFQETAVTEERKLS